MSFGLSLKDSSGFEYYNSSSADGEFVLILDVLRLNSEDTGSKVYSDFVGGNPDNLVWLVLPDSQNVKKPEILFDGTTLSWSPGSSGTTGDVTVLVSIS